MHRGTGHRAPRRSAVKIAATLVSAAAALSLAATALGAHPKAGRSYAGSTNESVVAGFRAPVHFKVSANSQQLRGFTYGSLGCFGVGGLPPGVNPYTKSALIKVGTVPVATKGHFSVAKAKFTYSFTGKYARTFITTTRLSGTFVTAKKATGTISFTQRYIPKHGPASSCGPSVRTFTAKLK